MKSDNEITEIIIEDDGKGYPKDILSKIGEPYLKTSKPRDKSKTGLGLGLFIGKTLLEKNFASLNFRNSKTLSKTGNAGIFAGSLELAKEGNISIKQDNLFEDIYIKKI